MNLRSAVEKYVQNQTSAANGQFLLYDRPQDAPVRPILFYPEFEIDDDRIFQTGPEEYVVCVDMTSDEGRDYDIDFVLHSTPRGNPEVLDVLIHRIGNQPRYDYEAQGDFLVRSPFRADR